MRGVGDAGSGRHSSVTTMRRAHAGDAGRAARCSPCSAPAACSWQWPHPPARQRAASPSLPAGVSEQRLGHPSALPARAGWHISGDHHLQTHPFHPTRMGSFPLFQGKTRLQSPRLSPGDSLFKNGVPSLPSAPPKAQQSGRASVVGSHGGAGSPTVCQVSWTMPAFSVRISMSCWASPSLNTMLLTVDTSVL